VFPAHKLGILEVTDIVGADMIDTFAVVELTQPAVSPVTVYVVFTVGLAETLFPLAELKETDGDHV
jgi:hypothetical protein